MKVARFWSRESASDIQKDGKPITVNCRGWSDDSIQAAAADAKARARRLLSSLITNSFASKRYLYGDRPLPEPVLQELGSGGQGPAALVTRNAYGAIVLNTAELMFIDIDAKFSAGGFLASLFGKKSADGISHPALAALNQYSASHPQLAFRIYRTAAGFRAVLTSQAMHPDSSESDELMKAVGADPLYIRLCRAQQSYRARLTPKPWRCGIPNPPGQFPYTGDAVAAFDTWLKQYEAAIRNRATCGYVGTIGSERVLEQFDEILRTHDSLTAVASGAELA